MGLVNPRNQFLSALGLVAVVALCGSVSSKADLRDYRDSVATSSGLVLQDDCVVDLALSRGSEALIRYAISCGVRDTKILTAVEPGVGQELVRISRRISPKGPGALGNARCALAGNEMTCRARRTGPVKFEGWLTVKPGTRCRDRFAVSLGGLFSHRLYPLGCPDANRLPLPSVAEIEQFRFERGLDLDLNADSAAIEARALALRQALRRGDPSALVARRIWGIPLRDIDLRELEYRAYYNIEGSAALYEWFTQNARDTYAGSWIDEAAGGAIYVRFTGDQDAQLAALRDAPGILGPERIVGYGVPALHSMAELTVLRGLIADLRFDETWNQLDIGLITRIGVDVKENKVQVGACDPESVAPALITRFGPEAPLSVVYRPPLEPKSKKVLKPKGAAAPLGGVGPPAVGDVRRRLCEHR